MKMELDDLAIVPVEPSRGIMERPYTGAEIKAQVNMIQEVMAAVMVEGHHYGVIPGTGGKPTMFKPGAEKLNLTFRIAPQIMVEDLSTPDEIRYRVICKAFHIVSGDFLGDGIGEASSNEEKYKWRRAVVSQEFDETAEDRRREPWKKAKGGKFTKIKQVRTNPADIANTVLKMAKKRALVDMSLTVTAASDVFAQDYEDMTEEMRKSLSQDEDQGPKEPKRKSEAKPKKKAAPPKAKKPAPKKATTPPAEPPPTPPGDPEEPPEFTEDDNPHYEEEETLEEDASPTEQDGDVFVASIVSVISKKKGTGPQGNPWELYRIDLSSGDNLSCFDAQLVADAEEACQKGVLCNIFYEENEYGYTLKGLEVVG